MSNNKIDGLNEQMTLAAKALKDRGVKEYDSDAHAMIASLVIAKLHGPGEITAKKIRPLFRALANQSAWRQKFEREEIFSPASKRDAAADLMEELQEELG